MKTEHYGAPLRFATDELAAQWCGSSRLKQRLFRVYCRLFGYPELAAHRRYRLIRQALASRARSCVVDVGTRNGLYAIADALDRPETRYVAIDISRPHLRRLGIAANQFHLRIYPLAARAESLPLPEATADLALTIEVLQFIEDDGQAVKEISRILRSGGAWWCEQELETSGRMGASVTDLTLRKYRPGHSVESLKRLAKAAGMRLISSTPVEGFIGRWWERLESQFRDRGAAVHLLFFPALRALSAATANRWTDRSPATVLYCFEKGE